MLNVIFKWSLEFGVIQMVSFRNFFKNTFYGSEAIDLTIFKYMWDVDNVKLLVQKTFLYVKFVKSLNALSKWIQHFLYV